MRNLFTTLAITSLLFLAQTASAAEKKDAATDESSRLSLSVFGWLEDVVVYPSGIKFSAKLDSGVATSSIDALNIERFQDLDGKEWVRFTIQNQAGEKETIEKPVVKWLQIKQKNGNSIQRPIVKMSICVGTNLLEGKMDLAKRSDFHQQVLVGRNMLANNILVDSGMRYTSRPTCKVEQK